VPPALKRAMATDLIRHSGALRIRGHTGRRLAPSECLAFINAPTKPVRLALPTGVLLAPEALNARLRRVTPRASFGLA